MFFKKNSKPVNNFFIADTIEELCRYFNLIKPPVIIEEDLDEVRFIEDINQRRRWDAEVLSVIAANVPIGKMLDIGTHEGRSAARMAVNSPGSQVYTVNIHPDDLKNPGELVTDILEEERIGSYYREKNLANIKQIFANTKTWDIPKEIDQLSLVYIDGCHDKEFVYSDTKKILNRVRPGGFILWHDCTPVYRDKFYWIDEVMKGIEELIVENIISGEIINVRNSWIGVWRKKQCLI